MKTMTTTRGTFTIRFTAVNQPSGRPDQDRVQDIPIEEPASISAFFAVDGQVGDVLTLTRGDYVRTWTLEGRS